MYQKKVTVTVIDSKTRQKTTKDTVITDMRIGQAVDNGLFDAEVGYFVQRELEHLKSKSYDIEYADLMARQIFPVSNEVGPVADTVVYDQYDGVAMAKIIEHYAKDLPRADVKRRQYRMPVFSSGISYGYTVQELRTGQATGKPLDARRAAAAVRGHEELVDQMAWEGDAELGLIGFFDNPNIPQTTAVNGGLGSSEWVNKTPSEMLFDINDIFASVFELTKMKEKATKICMPVSNYTLITGTERSDVSDTTIAQWLVNNSPWLNSMDDIIPLNELATRGAGGTGRMFVYNPDPDSLQLEVPSELEWFPTQEDGLEFVVPGTGRVSSVNIYKPLSIAFVDGI